MKCQNENFESAAHAVCSHTTNYAHSLFNKNINLCAVCSWDICLQLHFTCSCTAIARAHTQLPHDNRHWTCKRLPPDSIRIVAAYSIRYLILTKISNSQVPNIKTKAWTTCYITTYRTHDWQHFAVWKLTADCYQQNITLPYTVFPNGKLDSQGRMQGGTGIFPPNGCMIVHN